MICEWWNVIRRGNTNSRLNFKSALICGGKSSSAFLGKSLFFSYFLSFSCHQFFKTEKLPVGKCHVPGFFMVLLMLCKDLSRDTSYLCFWTFVLLSTKNKTNKKMKVDLNHFTVISSFICWTTSFYFTSFSYNFSKIFEFIIRFY